MSVDDDGVLRRIDSPQDALVALGVQALRQGAAGLGVGLLHVLVMGELVTLGEDGAVAFAGAAGRRVTTQADTIRLLDYHLSRALEAIGAAWSEYRLEGPELP